MSDDSTKCSVDVLQEDEEYYDDIPSLTDPKLLDSQSNYNKVINAIRNDNENILTSDIIYNAFYELITSLDKNRASVIDYLFESGMPHRFVNGKNLAILAAKQPNTEQQFDVLMTLKYFNVDFNEDVENETANDILAASNPALLRAITEIMRCNLWETIISSDNVF